MWDCATPATWNEGGCKAVPHLPRKSRGVRLCHACHAKRRWMRNEGGCEIVCVWSYCMWEMICDKVVYVWVCVKLLCESVWSYCVSVCVCNYCMLSLCVSVKLLYCVSVCVKLLYVKFVCVCEVIVCVSVCERWFVTKLYVKDGVCDKDHKVVCERWFVTRWCVTKLCVKDGVCDKVVCERWCVTKLYVKDSVWQEAGGGGGGGGHPGYRIKNKNPTQRCGEQSNKTLVAMPHDHEFAHSQSESSS